jgi:spermidine synthase
MSSGPDDPRGDAGLALAAFASGAVALGYETCWMRRLGLILGGTSTGAAIAVGAFLGGLALGGALADRLPGRPQRIWGALEWTAAAAAIGVPLALSTAHPWAGPAVILAGATPLGATWPRVARALPAEAATALYAWNTLGAVAGVLLATFLLLPNLGVRGSEFALAATGMALGTALWFAPWEIGEPADVDRGPVAGGVLLAAAATGFASLGLEAVWFRLAAVGLGATVQTIGLVLATFLATMSLGAALGRRFPANPVAGLPWALAAMGALAAIGASSWGALPYGLAIAWRTGGEDAMLPAGALLAGVAMGGAPAASGWAFSLCIRALGPVPRGAARVYAVNTAAGIAGAWIGGLWALPALEMRGAAILFASIPAIAAAAISRRPWPAIPALALFALVPAWDARLYAVGVYLRISDFADPSAEGVRRFADEGWRLLAYDQGFTGAVAVGESTRTGNRWLSINGKVDASTGEDMPTQRWSGVLPVRLARAERVAVVGLASGITAGAVLEQPTVRQVDVLELEAAVVPASRWFDRWSGAPLDDPRTNLVVGDARRELARPGPAYDAIVSEPSNPWISGVSNLFTREYWEIGRRRLRSGGMFCQWVQLYGIGTDELRGLVRTFLAVFPETRLFETIPGADVLLIGSDRPWDAIEDLPLAPRLSPRQVRWLAGDGWYNTDDDPRVEWSAPRWLHRDTGAINAALVEAASETVP